MLTPKQADKLIKSKAEVSVRCYGEVFKIVVVERDRWTVRTSDGGRFDRSDLELI